MDNPLLLARPQARGGMLLTLGILALLLFGPLTGVPAWYMANQDLRDIRGGILTDPHGLVGTAKVVAILGTFCSPLWLIFAFVFAEMALTMAAAALAWL